MPLLQLLLFQLKKYNLYTGSELLGKRTPFLNVLEKMFGHILNRLLMRILKLKSKILCERPGIKDMLLKSEIPNSGLAKKMDRIKKGFFLNKLIINKIRNPW